MKISVAIDFLIGALFLTYVGWPLADGHSWNEWMLVLVVIGAFSTLVGVAVQRKAAIAGFLQAVATTIWVLVTVVVVFLLIWFASEMS